VANDSGFGNDGQQVCVLLETMLVLCVIKAGEKAKQLVDCLV